MSRCGHAYIKQVMRDVDAIYGGEMSGHHYFRDMFYCDSGMVIWLLAMQIMSQTGKPLSELVADMETRFPITGEINRRVPDSAAVLEKVEACFSAVSSRVSHLDGLSMEFADWRFNLRASNTEPLLRLNVETRGDLALLSNARDALLTLIGGEPA
jgi:phosphomannomutase